ncbi:hypothetical protein AGOR_G00031660 [Albula goreensis]|uniref:Ig-like domain-containing protein n=1 Tax=Albula goreensis TaxID=1534307 RepID=A0A8T3E307_9TELE|nr:hypothetical protein AGOR_G00031660 [Albula goreensis]
MCNRFFLTSFGALYISDVQKEDALSTYRCITRHKYSGETRQSNGARLSVMDPTESMPSILDSFQSGEVQVGGSVELPCIASGYPNPTIRWLKDGRPLPTDSRWTRRLTGLTISDLRLEDSGNYICEVTNSFGSKEVTGHLNVIGTLIWDAMANHVPETCRQGDTVGQSAITCTPEPVCITVATIKDVEGNMAVIF